LPFQICTGLPQGSSACADLRLLLERRPFGGLRLLALFALFGAGEESRQPGGQHSDMAKARYVLGAILLTRVGRLSSDSPMGVININPANATATCWEGNNDTTTLEKDIISTVRVAYGMK
jgi:hypothetical protein